MPGSVELLPAAAHGPPVLGWILLLAGSLLPGLALVQVTRTGGDRAGALGAAIAASPGIGGLLVTLAVLLGASWAFAFALVAGAGMLVVGVAWRQGPRGGGPVGGGPAAAWCFAAIGCAVVGWQYVRAEWWRIASDAWTHLPIVRALAEGGIPPPDPWYHGFTLHYAWIYHAWVLALAAATGIDGFSIMAYLATASLAALVLAAGSLAARLHRGQVGWTLAFLVLGLNALFPALLAIPVARALFGATAGWGELVRLFAGIPRDADRTTALLISAGGQSWFLNKFVSATPLSLALAAVVAWSGGLLRLRAGSGRVSGEMVLAGTLTLVGGVLHPVVLLWFAGVTLAVGLEWFMRPGVPRGAGGGRGRALAWMASVGVAGLIAGGYYRFGMGLESGGMLPFGFSPARAGGLLACTLPGLLWLAPAIHGLRADGGTPDRPAMVRSWLALLAASAVLALVLRLPGQWPFFTVDKTSYLLWIPLALTAGGAFGAFLARRGRWARWSLALALLLPVNGLALTSRLADVRNQWRQPWDDPALARARELLPAEALLVVPPGDIDTPVFLERDTWDIDKADGSVRGYPAGELAARHALVDTLFRTGRLDSTLARRLRAIGRPVYAVWPDQTGPPWQRRTPGSVLRRFTAAGVRPPWAPGLPGIAVDDTYVLTPLAGTR
jgi:hypothetical protein